MNYELHEYHLMMIIADLTAHTSFIAATTICWLFVMTAISVSVFHIDELQPISFDDPLLLLL